ncbi:hypothetical protein HFD88_009344 [Aspergillus terreus]|nr:hypothetical protein HFD88_009344 [Aspergillus terreus]
MTFYQLSDAEGADNYYNPLLLWWYDFWVHWVSALFAWKCSSKNILLPFFLSNIGSRHCDVGVGTGYYLSAVRKCQPSWPEDKLTLVDFHIRCLRKAANRVGIADRTECVLANILEPIPIQPERQFDSISLMYVLHCLPGTSKDKGRVFANLKPLLKDSGTLFGSTLLCRGVRQNWFSWLLQRIYNAVDMFQNRADFPDDFVRALEEEFEEVESVIIGTVLMFKARKPRR